MKIGLITFHNALNYGAVMQTYATQRFLVSLGHECLIIDYVNKNRLESYNMKAQIHKQLRQGNYRAALRMIAGTPFVSIRRRGFEDFHINFLELTEKQFRDPKEIMSINDDFDYFVIGSDQVWNPKNNGSDMTYLLEFVNDNNKKVSYASSFGTTTIPHSLIGKYKENLSNIKHLSTREDLGVQLIKELTGREAKLVLDPVFLLEREEWVKLADQETGNGNPFIFVYTNRKDQFENMVKNARLDISSYKIHKINRHTRISDFINQKIKIDYFIKPQKFLSNILNAKLVATASFHGVAFSIIFRRNFVVFLTGDKGRDERILNLLRISGLLDRIYNESMTKEEIFAEIDYNLVEDRMDKYISSSKDFLRQIFM